MPLTHAFIDQEIQRIKNLEDVSKEEKAHRIETWEKMKAYAIRDKNLPENLWERMPKKDFSNAKIS